MIGVSLIVSSLVERVCMGNRVRVQLKTVVRISHHWGFAGTSQTTIPGLGSRLQAPNADRRLLQPAQQQRGQKERTTCFRYRCALIAELRLHPQAELKSHSLLPIGLCRDFRDTHTAPNNGLSVCSFPRDVDRRQRIAKF